MPPVATQLPHQGRQQRILSSACEPGRRAGDPELRQVSRDDEENIETEAVFNFAPGARILSMGNIGCMMNCDYCHNWQTSQASYVGDDVVRTYTPEQVVDECLSRGINIISWTYNDPVVWHEFVMDTAALARQHGIINLYKSAFYIDPRAIDDLTQVIDIFSLSLKSMDPVFYKRVTKGRLEPVLAGIEQVYRSGCHLELSMLLVTDANDAPGQPERVASWMLENLDADVPLHYVRFHPDYKYVDVPRTPIDRLVRARAAALELGMRYVYLGNVYGQNGANTYCPNCQALLIERVGLRATVMSLSDKSCCSVCGFQTSIRQPLAGIASQPVAAVDVSAYESSPFLWHGDINAVHVEVRNCGPDPCTVVAMSAGGTTDGQPLRVVPLDVAGEFRFMVSRTEIDQMGITVCHPGINVRFFEVFDRAHYPTQSTGQVTHTSDAVPEPALLGMPTQRPRSGPAE
ncbi:AmmeMemoRadiSam system radical SAM enzyme [Luedemannella flava]